MRNLIARAMQKYGKLPVLAVLGIVVLGVPGFAIWSLVTSDSFTGYVTSDQPLDLVFTTSWDDMNMDATAGTAHAEDIATLHNSNGARDYQVSITVTKNDYTNDTCDDYANDVTFGLVQGETTINNGDVITMASGDNLLKAEFDAVQYACPQSIDVTVTLNPQ